MRETHSRKLPTAPAGSPLDVEAILAGDHAAFEQMVRQESPRLFRVISRFIRDTAEAENVMQETFLQAYQRLDTFRREAKLTTWVYAIGVNLARASLRKSNRLDPLDEQAIERLQPSFSGGMYTESYASWNPQRLAELAERRGLVHRAIDQLPDDYRTIVTLRDIEELDTDEVAAVLNISNGAARVRLHRARQALRALLDKHLG